MTTDLAIAVRDAIRQAVGPERVILHEPLLDGNEREYLLECVESTFVSSVGRFVDRLEEDLARYTGAKRAVAVVNGTAALHLALRLAGVERDDEVLIPALTFAATAAAVAYCGAHPHFVESEESTLGLDPRALREHLDGIVEIRDGAAVNTGTGRVIRAVVPMHTFGHPVDMRPLLEVASDFGIAVVEDAAESLGSWRGERHTGTFGRLGTLSFNGNKIVTTGGGGALLTDDLDLAARAKHLSTTAKVPHRWDYVHDDVGYNYRMPNINAALGCAQLERISAFISAKRTLYERYRDGFAGLTEARIMREPEGCTSNYWLQALVLEEEASGHRDAILAATNDDGLMTRPVWTLLHELAPYRNAPRMRLPVAESLARRVINLPSSPQLVGRADA